MEKRIDLKTFDEYLELAIEKGASDVFITAGEPVVFRINGEITAQYSPILKPEDTEKLIMQILSDRDKKTLREEQDLDTSYSLKSEKEGRFRVNCAYQRGSMWCVLRLIETRIKSLEDLNLPKAIKDFTKFKRGFVLVTGPTGSGKSTTLASMIQLINETQNVHILTIEDPIEFLYKGAKSIINQREVGTDAKNFKNALKSSLREDPDVILIGEMRDLETIQAALTMAETGHLVFATLHTNSASATIDRIIDVFPANQQNQIKTQLASVLQGIVCQSLLPHRNGRERIAVCEILKMTDAARAKIKSGTHKSLIDDMQTGKKFGMQTFDDALAEKVKEGKINLEVARINSHKPQSFDYKVKGY